VAGAGVVSFVFYTTALDGGSVTVATGAVVLAETLPPAVVGVLFLGDTTRAGLAPLAWAGFVLAVASAILLARFGEPEPEPEPEPLPASRLVLSWWPVDLRILHRDFIDHGSICWPQQ
jgi:hypothetical protein